MNRWSETRRLTDFFTNLTNAYVAAIVSPFPGDAGSIWRSQSPLKLDYVRKQIPDFQIRLTRGIL